MLVGHYCSRITLIRDGQICLTVSSLIAFFSKQVNVFPSCQLPASEQDLHTSETSTLCDGVHVIVYRGGAVTCWVSLQSCVKAPVAVLTQSWKLLRKNLPDYSQLPNTKQPDQLGKAFRTGRAKANKGNLQNSLIKHFRKKQRCGRSTEKIVQIGSFVSLCAAGSDHVCTKTFLEIRPAGNHKRRFLITQPVMSTTSWFRALETTGRAGNWLWLVSTNQPMGMQRDRFSLGTFRHSEFSCLGSGLWRRIHWPTRHL